MRIQSWSDMSDDSNIKFLHPGFLLFLNFDYVQKSLFSNKMMNDRAEFVTILRALIRKGEKLQMFTQHLSGSIFRIQIKTDSTGFMRIFFAKMRFDLFLYSGAIHLFFSLVLHPNRLTKLHETKALFSKVCYP